MSNAREKYRLEKKKGDGILRTLFKGGHSIDHRGRVGGWGGGGGYNVKRCKRKEIGRGGGEDRQIFF
jgi:hypothetical protein